MQHIFLTGLSGSGKSTAGRYLAQRLRRPLFDIDALIEQEYGARISTIFMRHGEDYFRDLESRVLAHTIQQTEQAIIVTGGGIVVRAENRARMAKHGVRIYMQVDPRISLERLLAQYAREQAQGKMPELRPLLAGPDPLTNLQELLAIREAWYLEAEYTCSTNEKQVEHVAQEIIDMVTESTPNERAATGEHVESVEQAESGEAGAPIIRSVQVGAGYDTVVEWGGLVHLADYLQQLQLPPRIFLITDSNIHDLYIPALVQKLSAAQFEPQVYTVPAGEASKSQEQVNAIYDWLIEQHAERREALIALGGGVIGDLVGYVAATYLRGVPLIQIPTSLLAQVDSAIGGKTGINHPRGKNLIGAFYHPRLVLADPSVLLSLPTRSRTEGWAEIVKYGIILDAKLFALLEAHADALREFSHAPKALLCHIIARCIALKAEVIEEDEREQGRRAILNYGHTVGHALENASGYGEWLHGEAVSVGMVVAARLALEAGLFSPEDAGRQNRLLTALGLPTEYHGAISGQDILSRTQLDKKVVGKRVRWVMPEKIGQVSVTTLPDDLVQRVVPAYFDDAPEEKAEYV
jgi:shikimate kinase/3-dehydroquinate synthase